MMLHQGPQPPHRWAQGSRPPDSPTHHSLLAHPHPSREEPLSHHGRCPGPGRPPEMTCIQTQLRGLMFQVESACFSSTLGPRRQQDRLAQRLPDHGSLAPVLWSFPPCLGPLTSCSCSNSLGPVCPAGDTRPCACSPPSIDLWSGAHGGNNAASWVNTRRPLPLAPHESSLPTQGLTWELTGRPRPLLSETMRVMMVLRTVARNVLIPKTRAQSSLEREVAI